MNGCDRRIKVDVLPRGFPRPGLKTLGYCLRMSSEVNLPSAGSLCEFRGVSSTAFVSSA